MLVAIEGIDGSGKGTQTRLLEKRLLDAGLKVNMFSFPRYSESFFGREVGGYLDGQFGLLNQVHPKFSSLLYALDRFETGPQIDDALKLGHIVICDRYIGSNIAHQCARMPANKVEEMEAWIRTVEEKILHTRIPDINIFLDIDVEQSIKLVAEKEKRVYTEKIHDLHEASSDHLENALMQFRRLAKSNNWITVSCSHPNGKMRKALDISQEIYSHIQIYND